MRPGWPRFAAVMTLIVILGGCASGADQQARAKAKDLVAATTKAGVAPGLTVSVAESLYGRSAPQICDVLDDGVSTAETLLLTGNPSGRREKLITADAVTYERLVVKTYCPDELSGFEDLVANIDATKTQR